MIPLIGIATKRQVPLYLTGVLDDSPTKASAEITTSNRLNHNLLLCVVFYPNRNITDSSLPRLLNFVSSASKNVQVLPHGKADLLWTGEYKVNQVYIMEEDQRPKFYAYFSCLLCFYPVEGISDQPLVTNPCYFFIFLSHLWLNRENHTVTELTRKSPKLIQALTNGAR